VIEGVEIHRVPPEPGEPLPNKRTEENATARGYFNYTRENIIPQGVDVVVDAGGFLSYFFSVTFEIRRQYGIPVVVYFLLLEDNPATDPTQYLSRITLASIYDWGYGPRQRSQCFAVRAADTVVCLTEEDAATVGRLYRPSRLRILPPPVDSRLAETSRTLAPPQENQVSGLREHWVMFAGRVHDANKGAAVVRKAMEMVLAVRSDVRLVVVGNAEPRDFAALGSHVTCTGWVRDSDALAGWMQSADLLLMPSLSETFGMMCAEALSVGLPVIGSPVGGLPDMIVDGRNGYLLTGRKPSNWAAEIARHILNLIENPALLTKLKANAGPTVSRFSIAALGAQLEEICRETLDRRGRIQALTMPALDLTAQSRYLDVLSELGRRPARVHGAQLLPILRDESQTRCLACCRRGIFSNVRRVARTARRQGSGQKGRLRRAVFSTCPWSLVALKEQAVMAAETGRIPHWQLWWSRILFAVMRRLPR